MPRSRRRAVAWFCDSLQAARQIEERPGGFLCRAPGLNESGREPVSFTPRPSYEPLALRTVSTPLLPDSKPFIRPIQPHFPRLILVSDSTLRGSEMHRIGTAADLRCFGPVYS